MGRTNVSALSTPTISEICCTSRSAAARGMTFFPLEVDGARMCEYPFATATTSAATFSARNSASAGASACNTFFTPGICDAALAASPASCPATRICTSPPSFCAAATAFKVLLRIDLLSCSATTRTAISDHLGFVAQLVDQRLRVGHLGAGLALRRLDHFQRLQARRHVDAERVRLQRLERLLLRFHDVRQRDIARFVEAQVGSDDRRQLDGNGFQAAIDFTRDFGARRGELDLGGEGCLGPAHQRG